MDRAMFESVCRLADTRPELPGKPLVPCALSYLELLIDALARRVTVDPKDFFGITECLYYIREEMSRLEDSIREVNVAKRPKRRRATGRDGAHDDKGSTQ